MTSSLAQLATTATAVAEDAASVVSTSSSSSASASSPSSPSPSSRDSVAKGSTSTQMDNNKNQEDKPREQMILPPGFSPTSTDVIIGRGKQARTHQGNTRLRGLIELMIPEYSAAGSNKDEKSYIIKEIVVQIRKSSPLGGFVKLDKAKGRWFEVGDFYARGKKWYCVVFVSCYDTTV